MSRNQKRLSVLQKQLSKARLENDILKEMLSRQQECSALKQELLELSDRYLRLKSEIKR